jgi:hypothetical protein
MLLVDLRRLPQRKVTNSLVAKEEAWVACPAGNDYVCTPVARLQSCSLVAQNRQGQTVFISSLCVSDLGLGLL